MHQNFRRTAVREENNIARRCGDLPPFFRAPARIHDGLLTLHTPWAPASDPRKAARQRHPTSTSRQPTVRCALRIIAIISRLGVHLDFRRTFRLIAVQLRNRLPQHFQAAASVMECVDTPQTEFVFLGPLQKMGPRCPEGPGYSRRNSTSACPMAGRRGSWFLLSSPPVAWRWPPSIGTGQDNPTRQPTSSSQVVES